MCNFRDKTNDESSPGEARMHRMYEVEGESLVVRWAGSLELSRNSRHITFIPFPAVHSKTHSQVLRKSPRHECRSIFPSASRSSKCGLDTRKACFEFPRRPLPPMHICADADVDAGRRSHFIHPPAIQYRHLSTTGLLHPSTFWPTSAHAKCFDSRWLSSVQY